MPTATPLRSCICARCAPKKTLHTISSYHCVCVCVWRECSLSCVVRYTHHPRVAGFHRHSTSMQNERRHILGTRRRSMLDETNIFTLALNLDSDSGYSILCVHTLLVLHVQRKQFISAISFVVDAVRTLPKCINRQIASLSVLLFLALCKDAQRSVASRIVNLFY